MFLQLLTIIVPVFLEVGVNTVLKMVVQPALFLLLALALGTKQPYGHEGFLLTALRCPRRSRMRCIRSKASRSGT